MKKLRIASRPSPLALKQVKEIMAGMPAVPYQVVEIPSMGDKDKKISLTENIPVDFFTRELDQAVLSGSCDVGIHSAKDLPFPLPAGLCLFALSVAPDKTDSLVSRNHLKLHELAAGARVGTSSKSRKEEVLMINPDIVPVEIRGTIEERLGLVDSGKIEAIVIATCALQRLGSEHRITEILPFETHPLQGNLAVVGRTGDWETKTLFADLDIRRKYGKVTITGFGPGNPEYITVKGLEALKNADVIFYDDLIDKDYIQTFPGRKEYVGKRSRDHSYDQTEINRMLYEAARHGKNTVRLKGGDPAIFGRLGEELRYLQERFVDVEIIPGVTTASAASALAGIPLTQRNKASSVAFCSGHDIQMKTLPNTDTLVFYMGGSSLSDIVKKLITDGWKKDTPIAVISHVSLPEQSILVSELGEISLVNPEIFTPAIILVGKVIDKDLIWQFTRNKPSILVTGTSGSGYDRFGRVIHTPLIGVAEAETDGIADTIKNISEYDIIIFTSRYGVAHFFKILSGLGKDSRYLSGSLIVSIGKTTTEKLSGYGITPDIQPEEESSEGIIRYFRENHIKGKSILIPRSNLGLDVLPDGLTALGNRVRTLTVYKNEIPGRVPKIDLNSLQYVAFSSPSCIDNFIAVYGELPGHIRYVVRGRETRKKLMVTAGMLGIQSPKLVAETF